MELPFLTGDIPGCGGVFKASPEDFEVEELPAYEPSGEGEHLFVWVEKRGRSTQEVARALAQCAQVTDRDVSWAGLKDRQAVTRQYFCLPASKAEDKLGSLALSGVTVIHARRHRNKLKTGHLKGNRFRLAIRGVTNWAAAERTLEQLRLRGIPNFFGEQRFGIHQDNAAKGKAILLAAGRHRDRFERKLFLSAYQSELFNRVLARRVIDGTCASALKGDVLKKHATGGEFVCEDPLIDQPRVDQFEVSPTGPLFGPSMRAPELQVEKLERQILAEEGIDASLFEHGKGETEGARRLLRIPLLLAQSDFDAPRAALRLEFDLPAGSYATILLRELIKEPSEVSAAAVSSEN